MDDQEDGDHDHLQSFSAQKSTINEAETMEEGPWVPVRQRNRGKRGVQMKNSNETVNQTPSRRWAGSHSGLLRWGAEKSRANQNKAGKRHNTVGEHQGPGTKASFPFKFASGSSPITWKDICFQGRKTSEKCHLDYIELNKSADGTGYAKIMKSEIDEDITKWSNTLVGYFMGLKPFFLHIKACVTRM